MKTVLLIEDDHILAEMYRIVFSKEEVLLEIALDGEVGLAKVIAIKPQLIFLDIRMPKKDGLQVLQGIKNNPETQDIPIIMLTNIADPTIQATAMKLGAKDYLIKSDYVPTQIAQKAKELLAIIE